MNDITESRKVVKLLNDFEDVLVLFDNGETYKLTIEEDYDGEHSLVRRDPDNFELYELGAISREEYSARRNSIQAERKIKELESQLLQSWYNYTKHGPDKGFSKPSKFPPEVEESASKINWNTVISGSIELFYEGITYTIERPTNEI